MAQRIIGLAVAVSIMHAAVYAQPSSAEANLAAGVSQLRDGDALQAIFTLNGVVSELVARPEVSALLARAHAYRASAYIELGQPERAMGAALLALKTDPKIVVAAPDFSPAAVRLFADPAGFASAKPAENATKTETPAKTVTAVPVPAAAAMATIYVYRPGHYVGKLGNSKVQCDGQVVAELQNDRFFVLTAAPGRHDLKFGGHELPLAADGGRHYYFEVEPRGFGWSAKRVDTDTAAAEVREKNMKRNDANHTFSTECRAGAAAPAPSR